MLKFDRVAVQPENRVSCLPDCISLAIIGFRASVPDGVFVLQDAVTAGQRAFLNLAHACLGTGLNSCITAFALR
jgi:hypothetical protein